MTPRITVPIEGLSCASRGPLTLERVLASATGVVRVYVNPAIEMAYVEYDPASTSPSSLARVSVNAGFEVGTPIRR